jgi:hypothetical protein
MAFFPCRLPLSHLWATQRSSYLMAQAEDEAANFSNRLHVRNMAQLQPVTIDNSLSAPREIEHNPWQHRAIVSRAYAKVLLSGGSLG